MGFESFWDELVEFGMLDGDEVAEAQRRQRKLGGAPDTAILEVRPLGTADQVRLLRVLSRAFDLPLAPPEFLERPEPEALAFFPRELAIRHGLLPVHVGPHRLVVAAPALGPHLLSELSFIVGRAVEPYLALEIDLRRALRHHLDLALPDRHAALDERYGPRGPTRRAEDTLPPGGLPTQATPDAGYVPSARIRQVRIEPPAEVEPTTGRFRALEAAPPPAPPLADAELEQVIEDLESGDELRRTAAEARLLRAGEPGLQALMATFPGPLSVDRHAVDAAAVPLDAHGPVIRALLRFGDAAIPHVRPHASTLSPEARYYAVALLGALGAAPDVDRLFDRDPAIRALAAGALRAQGDGPPRTEAVELLRRALADEAPFRRRYAAEALRRLAGETPTPTPAPRPALDAPTRKG